MAIATVNKPSILFIMYVFERVAAGLSICRLRLSVARLGRVVRCDGKLACQPAQAHGSRTGAIIRLPVVPFRGSHGLLFVTVNLVVWFRQKPHEQVATQEGVLSHPFPSRNSSPSGPLVRVNGKIRAREVRVIEDEGKQLGILSLGEALTLARANGVDLVEIAPNATPPVCRLVDFGKFRYEQAKREKESKKHQHAGAT